MPPRTQLYHLGRTAMVTLPGLLALLHLLSPLVGRRLRGNWTSDAERKPPDSSAEPRERSAQAPRARGGPPPSQAEDRWGTAARLTAWGVVALAGYNTLFVVHWHLGEWYAPVSTLYVSLIVFGGTARLWAQWWKTQPEGGRRQWLRPAAPLLLLGGGAVQLVYFVELHRLLLWGRSYTSFCEDIAPRVQTHYHPNRPKLLSRDDGVVAFCTGFPTTSGTYLALDAEASSALGKHEFQQLLAERGVDRLTSLYYQSARGIRRGEVSPRTKRFAQTVLQAPPEREYGAEYVDGSFGIVQAR